MAGQLDPAMMGGGPGAPMGGPPMGGPPGGGAMGGGPDPMAALAMLGGMKKKRKGSAKRKARRRR